MSGKKFLLFIRSLDRKVLLLLGIFLLHAFLRFYDMEGKIQFNWDQVQNAWVMKNMIVDHSFPLLGMVAKVNSGIFIGPAYYYLLYFFYLIFDLDPVAAMVFVGVLSIGTFFALYIVTKRIFSDRVALLACFVWAGSKGAIVFDRTPWPVAAIPLFSLLIYCCLYEVISGKLRYLIPLATVVGLTFHFHFTAIFFPIIVLLAVPFFIRQKNAVRMCFLALPFFLVWFIPNILAEVAAGGAYSHNLFWYLSTYYHGLHMVRVLQLVRDAFIEYNVILPYAWTEVFKYLLSLAFAILVMVKLGRGRGGKLAYLTSLWFFVPLVVMATYSGEISNYYFSLSRPIIIIMIGFLLAFVFEHGKLAGKGAVIILLVFYGFENISRFLPDRQGNLPAARIFAKREIREGKKIEFSEGDIRSYLYYYYTYKLNNGASRDIVKE